MKQGLFIILVILVTNCFGQVDTTTIYSQALKYYNAHLDELKNNEREIFIENNKGITEKLPVQVGNRKVTVLTSKNQKEVYSENNNKLKHVIIFPAKTNHNLIEVNFTPYIGEYKGKQKGYLLGVSDSVIIQFKYDCLNNQFKYFNTKTDGI